MGAIWKIVMSLFITVVQIQAISHKSTRVTGVEGQRFDFRCMYPGSQWHNTKYFCYKDDCISNSILIMTNKHNQWVTNGRFSLYDNSTGAVFIVRVAELILEDSRTYWCAVNSSLHPDSISEIQLNVLPATTAILTGTSRRYTTTGEILPLSFKVDKLHLPLFLTALMCVSALLFMCLFSMSLMLLGARHHSSRPRHNTETSSDYETMMPGVRNEPELCSHPSALPPPPDLCSHVTSKYQESTVSVGHYESVDLDEAAHICHYQHLDLSLLEEHIYHSLHTNSEPKEASVEVKTQDTGTNVTMFSESQKSD
ncbi:uncharacterized protein LOC117526581 [Thalassophryne amazonica]|uniref:uncharacterized protein LOC117526581 n=1 Tax=Thalassophryne amazonica TaxID=390379 RepID=UPI00147203AF|nr:uncharacterized protein LOC117526581 [Thalassophryne amazonica]